MYQFRSLTLLPMPITNPIADIPAEGVGLDVQAPPPTPPTPPTLLDTLWQR